MTGMRWHLKMILIYILLMAKDDEYFLFSTFIY